MPSITITFGEMTPVDQFMDDDDGKKCPVATRDEAFNEKNKESAVETADYRDPADGGTSRLSDVCGTVVHTTRPMMSLSASVTSLVM